MPTSSRFRHTAISQVRASEAPVSQHWETRLPTAPASSKAPSKPSTRSTATTAIEIPDDIEPPPDHRPDALQAFARPSPTQNQERPSWRLPAPLARLTTKQQRRRAIAGAVAPDRRSAARTTTVGVGPARVNSDGRTAWRQVDSGGAAPLEAGHDERAEEGSRRYGRSDCLRTRSRRRSHRRLQMETWRSSRRGRTRLFGGRGGSARPVARPCKAGDEAVK